MQPVHSSCSWIVLIICRRRDWKLSLLSHLCHFCHGCLLLQPIAIRKLKIKKQNLPQSNAKDHFYKSRAINSFSILKPFTMKELARFWFYNLSAGLAEDDELLRFSLPLNTLSLGQTSQSLEEDKNSNCSFPEKQRKYWW